MGGRGGKSNNGNAIYSATVTYSDGTVSTFEYRGKGKTVVNNFMDPETEYEVDVNDVVKRARNQGLDVKTETFSEMEERSKKAWENYGKYDYETGVGLSGKDGREVRRRARVDRLETRAMRRKR